MRLFGVRSEAAKKSFAVVEKVGESYELGYKKSCEKAGGAALYVPRCRLPRSTSPRHSHGGLGLDETHHL